MRRELHYMEYLQRENGYDHPTFQDDMLQYEYIRMGDPRAAEEGRKNFDPEIQGRLSADGERNLRYLFVASATLACRSAIRGGLNQQTAYNASDLFIRRMDECAGTEAIRALHEEMFRWYAAGVAESRKERVMSLPVCRVIDYIYEHLNGDLSLGTLAAHVSLNPSYLSELFAKETGMGVAEYIRRQRVNTAKNMLRYSDYTLSEIAAVLAFSSQSHFTRVFREQTGCTPAEYRRRIARDADKN